MRHRLLGAFALVTLAAPAYGGHPFPASPGERAKAIEVLRAVRAGDQEGVKALTALLRDENPRVQAAAVVGLLRLSHEDLKFAEPLARVQQWQGMRPPFLRAALRAAEIALDHGTPRDDRVAGLIVLTRSEEGFERRMAVEALRGQRMHRLARNDVVLPALAEMADDPFDDRDGDFDGKPVGATAFEVWWSLIAHNVDQDERPPMLLEALVMGEPYRSAWSAAVCDRIAERAGEMAPMLLPLLEGENRRARLWAQRVLADIGGSKSIAALQDVWARDLGGDDELARTVAESGLRRHPDRRVLPRFVQEAIRDKELLLAWQAVYGLGKLDDEEALPKLRQAADDHRELVRVQAAAQLVHRGQDAGTLAVLTALTSETEIVRLIARWGLPKVPDIERLYARCIKLLKVKPDEEEKLPEQARDRLRRVRFDLLEDIYTWDRERQQHWPLVYAIRDLLDHPPYDGWAAKILRKLGHEVRWRDGKYHVTIHR
jgi:HEAT repeat protein